MTETSCGRRRGLLLPDRERGSRGHPGTFVEPERAGRVLRVDVEHDPHGSAAPQLAEAIVQEPGTEAGPTVRWDDADLGDPPDRLCLARAELAQAEADHLASGEREQPELGLERKRSPELASRRSLQNSASVSTCLPQCPANASFQAT